MAYFVTYRETDPVFAVDIGNPAKPELKSELKLSLFSIGEDYDIKEIDRQFGKKFTNCYATDNHRAVFVDQERGLVGFTMNEYAEHYTSSYFVYKYEGGIEVFDMATWKAV